MNFKDMTAEELEKVLIENEKWFGEDDWFEVECTTCLKAEKERYQRKLNRYREAAARTGYFKEYDAVLENKREVETNIKFGAKISRTRKVHTKKYKDIYGKDPVCEKCGGTTKLILIGDNEEE